MRSVSRQPSAPRRSRGLVMTLCITLLVATGLSVSATGCGGTAAVTATPTATPSPIPQWLLEAAQRTAADVGEASVDAAYWGLLHDPELGSLTASGPDDPSHHAYVIVLVGDFPDVITRHMAPLAGSSSSPLPAVRWILATYQSPTSGAGCVGCGRAEFDVSQYPSLQALTL